MGAHASLANQRASCSRPYTPLSPLRRRKSEEQEWYEVDRILDHRVRDDGLHAYLVKWMPGPAGETYDPTWEPEENINKTAIRAYHGLPAVVQEIKVTVDARPLVGRAIGAIAASVGLPKLANRPRVHLIPLPEISLPEIGQAFLRALCQPWLLRGRASASGAEQLQVVHTTAADGVEIYEVVMKELSNISDVCGFERQFAGGATGLLRFDIGRDHNSEMMAVGMPLVAKCVTNRVSGLITTTVQFPTCHFNGGTGHPQPPPATRGMLKSRTNITKLVKFVRALTPPAHPLAVHGWTALDDNVHELSNPINFPAPEPAPGS